MEGNGIDICKGGKIIIQDNIIKKNAIGFEIVDSSEVVLLRNYILYNRDGVSIYEGKNIQVTENIIKNSRGSRKLFSTIGGYGIRIYLSNPDIFNNIIKQNNGNGIEIYRNSKPKIIGNIITGNEGFGFQISTESYPVIKMNLVRNNYFGKKNIIKKPPLSHTPSALDHYLS